MTQGVAPAVETRVLRLLDLVNYQDGAVVSREMLRKRTGTVTLFAFDEGQGLSEHTAPCMIGRGMIHGTICMGRTGSH